MEWTEFLNSIGTKHKLTAEQCTVLIARLDRRNDNDKNSKIAASLDISQVQLERQLRTIYAIFAADCPDLASKNRGKLKVLKAYLWERYEREKSQPQSASPQPAVTPQNLPISSVVKFVGREEALKTVHQNLQEATTAVISSVSGMGGVGKTELALQYGYQQRAEKTYPGGICWINARAQDVGIGILDFARVELGLPQPPDTYKTVVEQVKWVCQRWTGEPILIILDDVADEAAVQTYLEALDSRFRVLITTRLKLRTKSARLELKVLEEADALELLRALVDDAARIDSQLEDAQRLCEWLGYLPLGLELVGRYLARKEDLSLAVMLERLEAKRLAARTLVKTDRDTTAKLGVAAAFELSWQDLPEAARGLAGLLSIFALAPIPWALVEGCLPEWEEEELEDCRDEELLGRSLLSREKEETYLLHSLIREFFAVKLKEELGEVVEELQWRFAVVLTEVAKTIPQTVTLSDIVRVEEALPHLEEVADKLTSLLENSTDTTWLFTGLARVAEAQSRWLDAEPLLQRALSINERQLGPDHPDTASSLNNLAGLYNSMGRYEEAESLLQRALSINERQLGPDHPDTATSLNNLAALYYAMGRYEEAEPLLQRALSIHERQLGPDHPSTAQSLNNLAALYRSMGRYEEAEPLLQRALSIHERQLGPDHPHTATSLNNLAGLYNAMGRYEEAEPLYQRALSIRERQLGPDHPHTAQSLNNLAGLYDSMGLYEEAEPLYQRALSIRERQLGPDHPHTAQSLNNLAALYYAMGRYEEAEPLYQRALSIHERQLGPDHPHTAQSLNNLAALYFSMGRYEEAEPLYLRALAIWTRCLPENHPHIQTAWRNFIDLIQQAVANGRAGELSAHPTTRAILQHIQ
nr:FxSxx-COOH system tetratricopeptide repeat protein [Oscillatoria sp. FACHB-1406]